jgi:hypothetical protein
MSLPGSINPYLAGPAITKAYGFYGREDILQAVVNTLTGSEQNAIVLHGQRRIGKSSLLHRLKRDEKLNQTHVPIFLDMQHCQQDSPARILADLAQTIADELSLNLDADQPDEAFADNRYFRQEFLPQIYSELAGKRLLFLFDEFDVVVPEEKTGEDSQDKSFIGYIQTLISQEKEHLAFVFVVGQRLDLLVGKQGQGIDRLFKGSRSEPVQRLNETETFHLVQELGKRGHLEYRTEALDEIWALTNGHPYISQLLGAEIFDRLQKEARQIATLQDVENCIDKAMEHGQTALNWFWDGFDTEARLVLSAIAELTDRHTSISDDQISQTLEDHSLILGGSERLDAYRQLLAGDFLKQSGAGHDWRYQFAVEFIRRWIVRYRSLREAQKEIEAGNPDAVRHYQLGQSAYNRGNMTEAVDHFRSALEFNPRYTRPQLILPSALRALERVDEAIAEAEKAYRLEPDGIKNELAGLYFGKADSLLQADLQDEAINYLLNTLDLIPNHAEARQYLARICVQQIRSGLQNKQEDDAKKALDALHKLRAIPDDETISQSVQKLWIDYAKSFLDKEPPQWNQTQELLIMLDRWGLLDATTIDLYNDITFQKAKDHLTKHELDLALQVLQEEIKPPRPIDRTKQLLIEYSDDLQDHKDWAKAEKVLVSLQSLLGTEDSPSNELIELYIKWGDDLVSQKKFEQGIKIYLRGSLEAKVTEAREKQLAAFDRDQFKQGILALRQKDIEPAFEHFRQIKDRQAEAIKNAIRDCLPEWANEAAWQVGKGALEALKSLFPTDSTMNTWLANWLWHWAEASNREASSEETKPEMVKDLCSEVLGLAQNDTPLHNLLERSEPGHKEPPTASSKLKPAVCSLFATITLNQAEDTLTQKNLEEKGLKDVQTLFQKALELPILPLKLADEQQHLLRDFAQRSKQQEAWTLARRATKLEYDLKIADSQTAKNWTELDIEQSCYELRAINPSAAFEMLDRLKQDGSRAERQRVRALMYKASGLYAGWSCVDNSFPCLSESRGYWDQARTIIQNLAGWLGAGEASQALKGYINVLFVEEAEALDHYLQIMQANHIPDKSLQLMKQKVEVIQNGLEYAQNLAHSEKHKWVKRYTQTCLELGQAYLVNEDLYLAQAIFKDLVTLDIVDRNLKKEVDNTISQSFYAYREYKFSHAAWDEAIKALDCHKSFDFPPREGKLSDLADNRLEGIRQRIVVHQARAELADIICEDSDSPEEIAADFEPVFRLLETLFKPGDLQADSPEEMIWPEKQVKTVIWAEAEKRMGEGKWAAGVCLLKRLDHFLTEARSGVRNQETLSLLVDRLEHWGDTCHNRARAVGGEAISEDYPQILKEAGEIFHEGLAFTYQAAEPRNKDLVAKYLQIQFELAQHYLTQDPLAAEPPDYWPQVKECLQKVLVEEHDDAHESQLNTLLHTRSQELAKKKHWRRANDILEDLEELYQINQPDKLSNYKEQFAEQRLKLALQEIDAYLRQPQPGWDRIVDRLNAVKIIDLPWTKSREVITRTLQPIYDRWLESKQWTYSVRFASSLLSLDPDYEGFVTWTVQALYSSGRDLSDRERYAEAEENFLAALEKASQQQVVQPEELEKCLLVAQLGHAYQELEQNRLERAVAIYRQILEKPPEYLGQAEKVKQALQSYTDSLVKRATQESDLWAKAHTALSSLAGLIPQDETITILQQELTLREFDFWLNTHDLEKAFDILATSAEKLWNVEGIQNVVQNYSRRIINHKDLWAVAIAAVEKLGENPRYPATERSWLADEYIYLGDKLGENNNRLGAEKAYRLAYSISPE